MSEEKTCPSGRCTEGALLLGIVQDDRVAFVHPALIVDADFVERVDTSALRRFRFAEPCVERDCAQWTGHSCGVIDEVLESSPPVPVGAPLPPCSIRKTCRWFGQSGRSACAPCRLVITEHFEAPG